MAPSFTDEPVSNDERVASIGAVKSPILEGEEEIQFRITLSREPPAGGVNVKVEIAPLAEYIYGNPVSVADYRTHNVHIGQGQTEAILEILTTRDQIASNHQGRDRDPFAQRGVHGGKQLGRNSISKRPRPSEHPIRRRLRTARSQLPRATAKPLST